MFVFSGRSTRSEVAAFFILGTFANMTIVTIVANGVLGWFLLFMTAAWRLFWGFPWIALFLRHLHDQGRTGWWALLLAAPATTLAAKMTAPYIVPGAIGTAGWRVIDWSAMGPWQPMAALVLAVYGIAIIAQLVLFLLPGTPGDNRHGRDPRA